MITTVGVFWRIGLAAIILFATGDLAWSQSDERAKLVEAAKKEGKLNWYTSTNTHRVETAARRFRKGLWHQRRDHSRQRREDAEPDRHRRPGRPLGFRCRDDQRSGCAHRCQIAHGLPFAGSQDFYSGIQRRQRLLDGGIRQLYDHRLQHQTSQRKRSAQAVGRSPRPQVEGQNLHRSGTVHMVRHPAQSLGPGTGAEIYARHGQTGYSMAQGAYLDRPADVRRRVSRSVWFMRTAPRR